MDWTKRFTEPGSNTSFRVMGLSTIYDRNPQKTQRLSMALAKLFRMEQQGIDYYLEHPEHQEYCSVCGHYFRAPDEAEYGFCPYCGEER